MSLSTLIFQIFQYYLGFIIDQTGNIMEIVNEWFPTGKFRKVDTNFRTDSTYENYLIEFPLTVNLLPKAEI